MVVLGPSGCGKTTLLKLIAGLLRPDSGDVLYDDVDVKNLAPGERRIGMVFQNYALYPQLVSRKNVLSYFLFRKRTPDLDAMARTKFERTSELMGVELAYHRRLSRVAKSSASHSGVASPATPRYSSSTNRSPILTKRYAKNTAST